MLKIDFRARHVSVLKTLAEMYKENDFIELNLKLPQVGCFVCAQIADVPSRNILVFESETDDKLFKYIVHAECADYLLDEDFLKSREEAVRALAR